MKILAVILIAPFLVFPVFGQPLEKDMNVFAERRATFIEQMELDGIAIFPSKPVYLRNLDSEYPYRQESNFYYLSGFEEPESVMIIDPASARHQFVLYVRDRNRRRETYDGPRAGVEGAMKEFRADTALSITKFERSVFGFIRADRPIYYTFGINPKIDEFMKTHLIEGRSGGNWAVIDPAPILSEMRLIKDEGDWRMGLQKAIDISAEAHIEAIKSIEPGMFEYEIQAVFEYIFRKNGSPRNGYPCIVGSGPNSTILHYNVNDQKMKASSMVVMDCGAEYGYYSADITRSVPVSGIFTKEQKDLYQIVLHAQKTAIDMVKPGIRKSELDSAISDILGAGLVDLGLIKDKGHHRMFSLHGYAHWIGLEVHDVGAYTKNGQSVALRPGMVFTVEPGLYVRPDVFDKMRERGYSETDIDRITPTVQKYMYIGIRIEDDIVVTQDGHRNLSASVPKEIADIERLMQQKGIGNLELTYR